MVASRNVSANKHKDELTQEDKLIIFEHFCREHEIQSFKLADTPNILSHHMTYRVTYTQLYFHTAQGMAEHIVLSIAPS